MSEKFSNALEQLQQTFIRGLPERMERMQACVSATHCDVQKLSVILHQLAGAGTTYGMPELSDNARKLEWFLGPLIKVAETPSAMPIPEEALVRLNDLLQKVVMASIAAPRPLQQPLTIHAQGRNSSGGVMTVLLVEDDEDQARHLQLQLSHFNCRVEFIQYLSDLESALHQFKPDIMVMDINFPEGDLAGPREVKKMARLGNHLPPIVYYTDRGDMAARLEAARGGGGAFFTKPMDVGKLVDWMDRRIRGQVADPYRVLIVEQSSSMAAYYAAVLSHHGMTTRYVTDPFKVLEVLSDFSAELVLSGMHFHACTGIELAYVLRQYDRYVSLPIVFLSADEKEETHDEAISIGTDDFLLKPIAQSRLVSAVSARVARYRTLSNYMLRDSLTGLFNHTTATQQLNVEIARAQRQAAPLCVAMLDIDRFKKINDTYGHPVGDRVICSLARLLTQRLRQTDVVARFGGEEFFVILPDTPGQKGVVVMDAIRSAFKELAMQVDDGSFFATVSIGVAEYGNIGKYQLTEAADSALYDAKREGRDRVTLFSPIDSGPLNNSLKGESLR